MHDDCQGQFQGEDAGGVHPSEITCNFRIKLTFCQTKPLRFIGFEVKHQTGLKNLC